MSAVVMKVIKADKHPFADALRLYEMEAEGFGTKQIIANLENIYEVGDKAIVILGGSILKDGTKISSTTKIRGLHSHGMALNKSDAEVGTDLSSEYCQEELKTSGASMFYWPDIEGLVGVRKSLEALRSTLGESYKLPAITYRGKIKLHGTNAAVQIHPDGQVFAQSRTGIINVEHDNAGFAKWVNDNVDYFKKLASNDIVTVFGEWCGTGVQKSVAISDIGKRIFAVFAVQLGNNIELAKYKTDPTVIAEMLLAPQFAGIDFYAILPDMYVLPWYGDEVVLDFNDTEQLRRTAEKLNEEVAKVEACDPWVKSIFKVEGVGEGIVFYPISKIETNGNVYICENRTDFSELFFKAKGEQHKVIKQKAAVQIDPEVAASVEDFVNMFVTPARLEQGVTTVCGEQYDVKLTGAFLKWLAADVQKESGAELEASKLDWAKVNKPVMEAARKWYQEKAKSL
jgi:tRNA-binding EMAP/Myf-like protein